MPAAVVTAAIAAMQLIAEVMSRLLKGKLFMSSSIWILARMREYFRSDIARR